MPTLYYIENKQLLTLTDLLNTPKSIAIDCQSIQQYTKNLQQIKDRKAWKTEGAGAMFMGATDLERPDMDAIYPTAISITSDTHLIYSARLQEGTAVQSIDVSRSEAPEGLILRKNNFQLYDINFDANHQRIIASASDTPYVNVYGERHLCALPLDSGRLQFFTEGECQDKNPFCDPAHPTLVYYDSCGLGYGGQDVSFGPRVINRVDLSSGELTTVLSDAKYDYFAPQIDSQGNLYAIRRPYREIDNANPINLLKSIVLAPVKIVKAIVGWLDFFTTRYAGESLKTSGANPARTKVKSEEELFIEGNLIKAHKTLLKNQADGDQHAGHIPKSWTLIKVAPDGDVTTITTGVMAYCLTDVGVVVSNGRALLSIIDGKSTHLVDGKNIAKMIYVA